MLADLSVEPFDRMSDGRDAALFTLENEWLKIRITEFGGRMVSIEAPDRNGQRGNVLLGFADVAAYSTHGGSFGTLLGRCANRIAGACFSLDGQTYHLSKNSGDATLHGGAVGFNRVFWSVAAADAKPMPTLVLTHISPDGDQGFPGELTVRATYRLDGGSLSLDFEARTSKPTIVNLSAHPYFNLGGAANGDVLGHEVTIAANEYLPTDAAQIPTGEIRPVAGTPFDFRKPTPLGSRIREANADLFHGLGYDHCFVLAADGSATLRPAVRVCEPNSGRVLDIHTDQPGLQVYTGNKLTGAFAGHDGVIYRQSAGLALEAQDFPDAPHHANFPSIILRPEQTYHRSIRYDLSVAHD